MPGSKAHKTSVMKSIELVVRGVKDNGIVDAVPEVISTLLNGCVIDRSLLTLIPKAF